MFAGELHRTCTRWKKAAEHLDSRGLAGAVGTQQAIHLSVTHLQRDVAYGGEIAKILAQLACADSDLTAQMAVVVTAGKRSFMFLLPQVAQGRDKSVLQRGLIDTDLFDGKLFLLKSLFDRARGRLRIPGQQVDTVTEALNVENHAVVLAIGAAQSRQHPFS